MTPIAVDDLSEVTTRDFGAVFAPPQVIAQIVSLMLAGSPFAASLTLLPTRRGEVAFPTAQPDRPAWLGELAPIPVVGLNGEAYVVGVAKLASLVALSNELVADADANLVGEVGKLLSDSAGPELDRGLLYGEGAPEPDGVVAAATVSAGVDLAAAITAAVGDAGDAGGTIDSLAARPSVFAQARNERDATGPRLWPEGIGAAFGLKEVPVPSLEAGDVLAYDSAKCYLVQREGFQVAVSADLLFANDAAAVRCTGRFGCGVPDPARSLRRLQIGAEPQPPEPQPPQPQQLSSMTAADLRDLAAELGLDTAGTKAELIARIQAAQAG